ncbi:hypothetical protein M8C21_009858 [Ambrosia artemisiifolia]|uniref:Uncharacterized protein n=1 Tax=Ambrosia artemisiifolia TaxID=4212 RepID=A0AAD5C0U8_AMBAR|nr:hypothetical protein M8C21_009858 [Ambrosia artemisiifolia]
MWIHKSSETGRFAVDKLDEDDRDSTSSSSIGNNSDASGGGCDSDDDDDGGGEVQSLFKGSLNNLSDLEQALALKRGISTFYSGKSKSYTSLADAVSVPSIQDIVKPEDAYNRKRKNMLAHSVILNKNPSFTSKSGITKKVANANRGPLASELNNNHHNSAGGESSSPGSSRPPLPAHHRISPIAFNESLNSPHRSYCSPWRSYSLSDLQLAGGGGGAASSFKGNKRDDENDD